MFYHGFFFPFKLTIQPLKHKKKAANQKTHKNSEKRNNKIKTALQTFPCEIFAQ
jgi:hypothetical protein